MGSKTYQVNFWEGEFGNRYITRNQVTDQMSHARVAMWSQILRGTVGAPPTSILEVGANIGINLRALRALTSATLYAIEPNKLAMDKLVEDGVVADVHAMHGIGSSIALADRSVDLVFTSGVLIHVHPDDLAATIDEMHRVAKRYIICVEYFSDKPETIAYHGETNLLFKRDFGDFWMDRHKDLRLLDYGFFWKRVTGLDNLTWWLWSIDGHS